MNALLGSGLFILGAMEYLVVIVSLVGLYLLWKYMSGTPQPARARSRSHAAVSVPGGWFRVPDGLFFHRGHSWASPDGRDVVRIGLDDFAQKLLGKAEAIDLPQAGTRLERGEVGWTLRVDSHDVPMLCPVAGEVVAANSRVAENPGLVNDEPYEDGWLLKVRVPAMKASLHGLLSGRSARSWMEKVTDTLRLRMGGSLGTVLQDGGVPVTGFAATLDEELWDEVVAEYLLTR